MRKIIAIALIGVLLAAPAFAGVQKVSVERNVATQLLSVKSSCTSWSGRLINIRDSVAAHASEIDAGDLTKLNDIKTEMNTAISALNDVVTEITTQFPDIE